MATGPARAAPPADEPRHPVIVKLKDKLPHAAANLADPRAKERRGFGALKPEVFGHIQQLERAGGFKARHGFSAGVKGFSAALTDRQIERLRASELVETIEPDVRMRAMAQVRPYGIVNTNAHASSALLAGDGLDNAAAGLTGVRVAIIDSGVAAHPDLNLVDSINLVGDGIEGDCNGHGTHVAGTVGARDNDAHVVGVAPGVALSSYKVLGCDGLGYASHLIKAFDLVAAEAKAHPGLRYVANASIGFPPGTTVSALDTAIASAVSAGVVVAVAAGNDGADGCSTVMVKGSSGTLGTGLLAVSAADAQYREGAVSNYGQCVALWAPGVSVTSTSSSGGTATKSGTSMASPHVAGAAAAVLAVNPTWSPAEVDSYLKTNAFESGTYSKDGRAIRNLDVGMLSAPGAMPAPEPEPLVSVATPQSPIVDFGTAKVRKTVYQTVTLSNTGTAAFTVARLKGLPSSVKLASSSCSKVQPGASCQLKLSLSSTKPVTVVATVTTVGADVNASFAVKGVVTK